jgi:phosphoribosyl 1,2-cyclic phosphodiesterase
MRVHLLGVRGSTPAPGIEFARYGGNTSCVAIARHTELPSMVLDAGTGIQQLAALLDGAPFEGTVLLSHLHWDHVEGLPFCTAVDRDDARTDLFVPAQLDGTEAAEALGRMMSPPNFPIGPEELRGKWSFSSLEAGSHLLDQFSVTAAEVAHKGGRTFGYRVTDGRSSLAYVPDHCPTLYGRGPEGWGDYPRAVVELVQGADVLVHDALLSADELPDGAAFGHAALEYAVALGAVADVGTVVLFHHSHRRTDAMLDVVRDRYRDQSGPRVMVGAEGTIIDL